MFLDILNEFNTFPVTNWHDSEKLDLSKKEDVEKALKAVDNVFDNPWLEIFFDKSYKEKLVNAINAEHDKLTKANEEIKRPSLELNVAQLEKVTSLANEYVENVIKKSIGDKMTAKQYEDIKNSLIDYSAWIIKHE